MKHILSTILTLGFIAMNACQTTKEEFEVTDKSVASGTGITWLGSETRLIGSNTLQVGANFRPQR